jgi:hypothetical protein
VIRQLSLGCLYLGGGANTLTPPNRNSDGSTSILEVASPTCDQPVLTLRGSAGTGERDCTLGPAAPGPAGTNERCFFGPPLPIPAGIFTTCVLNKFRADVTGQVNQVTGQSELAFPLTSLVYLTSNNAEPCPRCVSGRCTAGARQGLACEPVGTQATSFDCPPLPPQLIGPLGVTLAPLVTDDVQGTTLLPRDTTGRFCPKINETGPLQPNPGAFGFGTVRRITQFGKPAGDLRDRQPHDTTVSATFCVPPTGNGLVDGQANIPGPGAVSLRGNAQLR